MGTEWVDAYLAAWNSHDGGQVAAFMAEDVTYEDFASGGTFHGREGVRTYVGQTHQWSADYTFSTMSAQSDGERYAIEWEMLGTDTGGFAGAPPTGRPYRIRGASVGELNADGLIAANHDYGIAIES